MLRKSKESKKVFKTIKMIKKNGVDFENTEVKNVDLTETWDLLEKQKTNNSHKLFKSISLNVSISKIKETLNFENFEWTLKEFCIPFINNKKNKKIYYWSIFIAIISRIFFHGFYLILFAIVSLIVYKLYVFNSFSEEIVRRKMHVSIISAIYGLNFVLSGLYYWGFKKDKTFKRRTIIKTSTTNIFVFGQTKKLVKKCFILSTNDIKTYTKNLKFNKYNKKLFVIYIVWHFHLNLLDTFFFDTETNQSEKNVSKYKNRIIKPLYKEHVLLSIYKFYSIYSTLIHMLISVLIYAGFGYLIYQVFLQNL